MRLTNRRRTHTALGIIAAIATALTLAGCSNAADTAANNTTSSKSAGSLTTLSVANLPIADQGSYFYALDTGIFTRHGLDIKTASAAGGSAAIAAMVAGDYDVVYSGTDGAIKAFANNIPVKVIAGANTNQPEGDHDATGLVVAPGITSVDQLKGATIGTNALGNINQVYAQEYLAQKGVTDVKVVEIPFPEQVAALESKKIAATLLPEPFASQALSKGATILGYPYRVGKNQTTAVGVFAASDSVISQKSAALKEFVAAMKEASDAANNPAKHAAVVNSILNHTKLSSDVAGAMTFVHFTTDTTSAQIQAVADLLTKFNVLKTKVDAQKLIANLK